MRGKIIVVTHKDYPMPVDDVYLPVCVGNNINVLQRKFQSDAVGDSISNKNSTYRCLGKEE